MEPCRVFFDVGFQGYKILVDEVGNFFVTV